MGTPRSGRPLDGRGGDRDTGKGTGNREGPIQIPAWHGNGAGGESTGWKEVGNEVGSDPRWPRSRPGAGGWYSRDGNTGTGLDFPKLRNPGEDLIFLG